MNASKENRSNKPPQWQSEKMKNLIEERWSEVWEIVVARERSSQNSLEYLSRSQVNSNF